MNRCDGVDDDERLYLEYMKDLSVLSPLLFAIAEDVLNGERKGLLNEILTR